MSLVILHHLLNVSVQLANKRRFKQKKIIQYLPPNFDAKQALIFAPDAMLWNNLLQRVEKADCTQRSCCSATKHWYQQKLLHNCEFSFDSSNESPTMHFSEFINLKKLKTYLPSLN
jgi:hypothetical protein